jgi:hypothetical protein
MRKAGRKNDDDMAISSLVRGRRVLRLLGI